MFDEKPEGERGLEREIDRLRDEVRYQEKRANETLDLLKAERDENRAIVAGLRQQIVSLQRKYGVRE